MKGRINFFLVIIIILAIAYMIFTTPKAPYVKPSIEIAIEEPYEGIVNVTIRGKAGSAVFDQAHKNTFSIYRKYSQFASLLGEAGYIVKTFEAVDEKDIAKSLGEKIKGARLFIIASPNLQFKEEEINEILKAVEGGTNLILLGESNQTEIINKLSFNFGIIFNNDFVYDLYNYSLLYKYPIIQRFEKHEITKDLNKIALYDACSLTIFEKAKPLAYASEKAKSIERIFEKDLVMMASSTYGAGKIFAICDADIFSNENIANFENKLFAINLINWS